ncbi:MAG: hypothetical protein F6K39_26445 [Okeania sp. SIO3B3]|nr:hypothetical protein [Okeania sp. SIO3B3]
MLLVKFKRRRKEGGRRKKEEGRRKKEEGKKVGANGIRPYNIDSHS